MSRPRPRPRPRFLRATAVPAGTAESRERVFSYGDSVCTSVRPSRAGTDSRPGEIETPGLQHSSPYYSLEYLVSYDVIWCRWVGRFNSNEGIKEGHPPIEIVLLPLLALLA